MYDTYTYIYINVCVCVNKSHSIFRSCLPAVRRLLCEMANINSANRNTASIKANTKVARVLQPTRVRFRANCVVAVMTIALTYSRRFAEEVGLPKPFTECRDPSECTG